MENQLKHCRKCNQWLSLEHFTKLKTGKYYSTCKQCVVVKTLLWRKNNPEGQRKLKKEYYERRGKHIHAEQVRKCREKKPELYQEINKKWTDKNYERALLSRRISQTVTRAIKKGTITRANSCEICSKSNCKIEAAHSDYSKPLDIKWLCVSCHRKWDRNSPKTSNTKD